MITKYPYPYDVLPKSCLGLYLYKTGFGQDTMKFIMVPAVYHRSGISVTDPGFETHSQYDHLCFMRSDHA